MLFRITRNFRLRGRIYLANYSAQHLLMNNTMVASCSEIVIFRSITIEVHLLMNLIFKLSVDNFVFYIIEKKVMSR